MTEVVQLADAQRRAERIRFHATNANDAMTALRELVNTAREMDDHLTLGYPSWTAYIRDLFGDEPLRLARDVRQELVAELSAQGMSTRAIAPIVGVSKSQVAADIEVSSSGQLQGAQDYAPALVEAEGFTVDTSTGEVIGSPAEPVATEHTVTEKIKTVTGLDGKEYTRPEPKAERRRALTESARDAGWNIRKATEKLQRIHEDDRFSRNKEEMATLLRSHIQFVIETCQGFLDDFDQ